jgi:3'-5' exoribonuclease
MPQSGLRPGFVQDNNSVPVYPFSPTPQHPAAPKHGVGQSASPNRAGSASSPIEPFTPVIEMVKNTRGEGFLIVRTAEQRSSSNGSKYLDMTLCDKTGEINAKVWDTQAEPPEIGSVLLVKAQILEYNGKLQMRVDKMRATTERDEVSYDALIPCAPENPAAMLAEIRAAVATMTDKDLRELTSELLNNAGDALLTVPAALKLHHAERGGLLHHTVGMLRLAKAFVDIYPVLDNDLLLAGVIAHDLAKLSELTCDNLGLVKEYSMDGYLLGHLVRGVVDIELAARRIGADHTKALLLQHMILAHHGEPEFGSPRRPMFLEAEILHIIDLADARVNEMSGNIAKLKPGGFSEKIWSLDRRLYRIDRETGAVEPKEASKP